MTPRGPVRGTQGENFTACKRGIASDRAETPADKKLRSIP
jgi:hypothetical protein